MNTCPNDGKVFEPRRRWQRFCSSTCRYQFRWRSFTVVPRQELEQLAAITGRLLTHEATGPRP